MDANYAQSDSDDRKIAANPGASLPESSRLSSGVLLCLVLRHPPCLRSRLFAAIMGIPTPLIVGTFIFIALGIIACIISAALGFSGKNDHVGCVHYYGLPPPPSPSSYLVFCTPLSLLAAPFFCF